MKRLVMLMTGMMSFWCANLSVAQSTTDFLKSSLGQNEAVQLALRNNAQVSLVSVRQAWVRTVAAQQMLGYTKQVLESAEASAELAHRLQRAGNLTKLDHARQQAFYLDAQMQLIRARQSVSSTRSELMGVLGLHEGQDRSLIVPDRLPNLPEHLPNPKVGEHDAEYRTAYEIAQQYRQKVVPLYQVISEENRLRYNGMFISVFELLADARDQINHVMDALVAEQQFWLADAVLMGNAKNVVGH